MKSIKRVLFKTRSSAYWKERAFRRDFVHLSGDAARLLVELGLRLVGIDYLSIEKFGSDTHEAHRTLLEAGVVALEGLNLSNVPAGMYELLCLPLAVAGGDGAPCRAILLEKEEAVCRIERKTG
jgi:arylformamidase